MAMGLLEMGLNYLRRIPFERVLFPPRDNVKALQEFMSTFKASEVEISGAPAKKATVPPPQAQGVAQGGSTAVVTREGVDADRMAWQDGIIRGELWLLEGHLKNNCLGCGGDVECCWKHTQNTLDSVRETQSMTTEPLYREAAAVAERILPFVHPEDVKAGKYVDRYPALTLEVSRVRTQFDKKVMGYARKPITLEEAKKLAAEEATKEVEKRWEATPEHSQETMFFNVPEARQHLISKGFVYTLRPKMRKTGKDTAFYGSYYKKEKIGDVQVDFLKEILDMEELKEYVSGSGFTRVEDWWEAAEGSRFLFKVILKEV